MRFPDFHNPHQRRRLPVSLLCRLLFLIVLFMNTLAESSELNIQPTVTLREEYTDNVYLTPAEHQEDYMTSIAPSLRTIYKATLWDWDAAYTYDYRIHARSPLRNEDVQTGHIATLVRIVPEFFFLDVRDDYTRVSLDSARDFTQESNFVNQTDRNIFSANPYFVERLSDRTTATAGYLYRRTWYKSTLAVDTIEHVGSVDLKQELSTRTTMNSGVHYTRNENNTLPFSRSDVYLGPTYEYAEGSLLSASAGYSRFEFDGEHRKDYAFWDARATYRYSTLTASAEAGISYIADPLQIVRRQDRGLVAIGRETQESKLQVTGSITRLRDAETNRLETTTTGVTATASQAITATTKISGSVTADRLRNEIEYTSTKRYLTSIRLERAVRDDFTWALEYNHSTVQSPEVFSDNYRSNRIAAELKKTF